MTKQCEMLQHQSTNNVYKVNAVNKRLLNVNERRLLQFESIHDLMFEVETIICDYDEFAFHYVTTINDDEYDVVKQIELLFQD